MAARDEPGGIEPAIGLAVIRQPVDVPMADERRIGGIDGRPAADEDDAARKILLPFLVSLRSVWETVMARPLAAPSAALSPLPGYVFRMPKSPRSSACHPQSLRW